MRTALRTAIAVVIVLSFVGCMPTRFASYRPLGGTETWPIKADWSISEGVGIRINDEIVIKGRMPMFGTNEYKTQYRSCEVRLLTTYDNTAAVYINGDLAGQFSWASK